jgi:hypothetical protein
VVVLSLRDEIYCGLDLKRVIQSQFDLKICESANRRFICIWLDTRHRLTKYFVLLFGKLVEGGLEVIRF